MALKEVILKKRWFKPLMASFVVTVLAIGIFMIPIGRQLSEEAQDLAVDHFSYTVSHPGWSFPARIWSQSFNLEAPFEQIEAQALIRGYEQVCPAVSPGQICADEKSVIPRGGVFPEGFQPAGTEGWTRPLALEPIRIGTFFGSDAEYREHLPLDLAPKHLIDAIIAAEDRTFWEHGGVDFSGFIRAAKANLFDGTYQQGASTLTMQVVRNLSGDKQKTVSRKLREMGLSLFFEKQVGKTQVLQAYLDAPYLGQYGNISICGFETAALRYWGIHAWELSLAQSATLASILPSPGRFAPDQYPEQAKTRRNALLEKMALMGYNIEEALDEPVNASKHDIINDLYPAYLQATRAWLEQQNDPEVVYSIGLDVFTALDPVAQSVGDKVFADTIPQFEKLIGTWGKKSPLRAAGALIDNKTGYLVAVNDAQTGLSTDFSRVTQAKRQPGSSFKPLIYALAFTLKDSDGKPKFNAASTVSNMHRRFENTNGWAPRNISGDYSTTSTLAMGLAWSQNVATASLLEEIGGPEPLIEFADQVGFDTSTWPHEMGLALGQGEVTVLEMTRFVSTIVAKGFMASGRPVIVATDPQGKIRIEAENERQQVIPEDASLLTRDLMRLVIEYGTGGRVRGTNGKIGYNKPAIGKTGTTDGERDVWFVGASPRYSAAVWLGHDQPERIGATASDLAAPLWGWWMNAVHKDLELDDFEEKLSRRGICRVTGGLGNETCTLIPAPFLPGTSPNRVCNQFHEPEPEDTDEEHHYISLWERRKQEQEQKLESEQSGE